MSTAVRTVLSDIVGTFSNYFRVGKTGFRLKNNAGTLELRDAGDTGYTDIKANKYYDSAGNEIGGSVASSIQAAAQFYNSFNYRW